MKFTSLFSFFAIFLLAAGAQAQTAQAPQYPEGYVFQMNWNGQAQTWRFLGYTNDRCPTAYRPCSEWNAGGNRLILSRHASVMYGSADRGTLRFPLSVGKTWTHHYQHQGAARTVRVRVVAYEKVTVGGEAYDAYKLVAENQRYNRPLPAHETYWYAPAFGYVVKYQSREFETRFGITGASARLDEKGG